MKKTALIYSFHTSKTQKVAEKIQEDFGKAPIVAMNVESITEKEFLSHDNLILGASTWFDGELPNFWDEFVPAIEDMDLHGKTIAIFGNGDQIAYGDNFVDAIGILANLLESRGAKIVGMVPASSYTFIHSRAQRGDLLAGLALDWENQPKLNNPRIKAWVAQLKKELP